MPSNFKATSSNQWSRTEQRLLSSLSTPAKIQAFLDTLEYSIDDFYRCPRRVIKERVAHCADGAVFAAAALQYIGFRPLLVDLLAIRDDDHILAVFRGRHGWGALSKSNTVGLRYREPIHRNLRELVVSYFEWYFNLKREKTLRSYSMPVSLTRFDCFNWLFDDHGVDLIMEHLEHIPHRPILQADTVKKLRPVDERCFKGGLYGTRWEGLYGYKKRY